MGDTTGEPTVNKIKLKIVETFKCVPKSKLRGTDIYFIFFL